REEVTRLRQGLLFAARACQSSLSPGLPGRMPIGINPQAARMNPDDLMKFATRYAAAWCGHDPERVADCYEADGSLSVNDGPPRRWPRRDRRSRARIHARFSRHGCNHG